MKNLSKNWIAIAAIVAIVFFGGYYAVNNSSQQSDTATETTSTEQVQSQVEVTIDYAGEEEKETEVKTVKFDEGDTAWDALKSAVEIDNIEYQDYGGDLGIFVQSINDAKPTGNKFWLFKVNGKGADVGISSYKVQDGDKIEFVISEPSEGQG